MYLLCRLIHERHGKNILHVTNYIIYHMKIFEVHKKIINAENYSKYHI